MARVSIYVSDELKTRMNDVGEAVNWSDIARPAFENAIADFTRRKGQAMNVIDRLRASKNQYYSHLEKSAVEDGRNWASKKASFYELKEIIKIDLARYEADTNGFISYLYNTLDELNGIPFETWVSDTFGVIDPGDDWAFYFTKGAQAVFNEVKDQI
jgi:predicted transcriptional regulator